MQNRKVLAVTFGVMVLGVGVGHADFKYTQSSKMTGGSLMTMAKTLGVFSKNARQLNEPQTSTIMVKSNRMRSEHSDGQVQIIDLDARRFIYLDSTKKTYSTMTFEEFKAAMQRAQERAKEAQAKAAAKNPDSANMTMVPKFSAQETGATRTILDLPTKEVKWRLDMEFQSTDPKVQQQAQSAAMTTTSDSWIAASVPGYEQMRDFYLQMSKELDWLPSAMGNMTGLSPQMGPAMKEFQKNAVAVKGMPLLQYVSMGMAATGVPQNQTPSASGAPQSGQTAAQQPPAQQPAQDTTTSVPTNARDAISKGIGNVFGGFGKKKKQDQAPAGQDASTASATSQPTTNSGSLMDMQIEVTSFSNSSLDSSLFEIPAGYTQVQRDPDQAFGAAK